MNPLELLVYWVIPGITGYMLYRSVNKRIRNYKRYFEEEYVPNLMQNVLNDVGNQFTEIFEKPAVKHAMSVMGKASGVSRASDAALNKFNQNIGNLIPSVQMISERMDMSPIELMSLWNDPLVGPMIKNFVGQFMQQRKGKSLNSKKHPFIP